MQKGNYTNQTQGEIVVVKSFCAFVVIVNTSAEKERKKM